MKKLIDIMGIIVEVFIGIGAWAWFVYYTISFGIYTTNHWTCCVEPYELLMGVSLMMIFAWVGIDFVTRYYNKIKEWVKSKKSEVAV